MVKVLMGALALLAGSAVLAAPEHVQVRANSVIVSAENESPAGGGDTDIIVRAGGKPVSTLRGNTAVVAAYGGKDGKAAVVVAAGRSKAPVCTAHGAVLFVVHADGRIDQQEEFSACTRVDLRQDGDKVTLSVWAKDAVAEARPEKVTVWRNGVKQ